MRAYEKNNSSIASFSFKGPLLDFISFGQEIIHYSFRGAPSVKDAIEAIGVPHVEVCALKINDRFSSFLTPLKDQDHVIVYSFDDQAFLDKQYIINDLQQAPHSFIVDVQLGTLARSLRMLGMQADYNINSEGNTLIHLAHINQKTLLTRNKSLLKYKALKWGYWIRSQEKDEQLIEVINHFQLKQNINPFTICMNCNGELNSIDKALISENLQPLTKIHFNEFLQCKICKNIFWKGSHYERMQENLQKLLERL